MKICKGTSRIVLLIGNLAIKIPRLSNGRRFFVIGMLGNVNEAKYFFRDYNRDRRLAEVLFCFPFGLFSINKRYDIINDIEDVNIGGLGAENLDYYSGNCKNLGRDDKGNIKILDYGNSDFFLKPPYKK
jgi:hypothetical protein